MVRTVGVRKDKRCGSGIMEEQCLGAVSVDLPWVDPA